MRVHHGLTLLCVLAAASACRQSSSNASVRTQAQKESYAVGANIGEQMRASKDWIDTRALERGLEDALAGRDLAVSRDSVALFLREFGQTMQKDRTNARAAQGAKNLAAGKAFLAENAKKKGVETTKSGLQYEVLREGDGPRPDSTDQVTVQYEGKLTDGRVFDSSYKRGQPMTLSVNRVIRGLSEGLRLMRVGSKYRFVVPPDLAYGPAGAGEMIGPNATLIFEVELLKIDSAGPSKKK